MSAIKYKTLGLSTLLSGVLAASLLQATPARAQDGGSRDGGGAVPTAPAQGDDSDPGYRIGEDSPANLGDQGDNTQQAAQNSAATDRSKQGPVRMTRFSVVSGNITWRADDKSEWAPATVNLPIQQGAQIRVADGGRADLQFDDGSELRLGNGALITLKLLYSDAQGEFTQITLTDGLATLRARHDVSVYQVDTPMVSVKSRGPSQVRFGIDSGAEVAAQQGAATVEGPQGKITLHEGDYLDLADGDAPYKPHALPHPDSWDRWNTERNQLIDSKTQTERHVPPNIGLVAGDLDQYGTWREDPKNGWVWVPRVASPDWRPYHDGRWVWVEPYGWTWVGDEAWGWAPYHYGTWVDEPYGWAWCPGPTYQYWSPAVVDFSVYAGNIGWAPLCPWEVRYPAAFGLGFWGNNWGFSFSIGWAGCYYPGGFGFCIGRPWNNYYVNHWDHGGWDHGGWGHDHFGADQFGHGGFGYDHNNLAANHGFVPYNASHAAGATVASADAFGGRGAYRAVPRGETALFAHGQTTGMPTAGHSPFSGPATVQPTRLSTTPTRSFASTAGSGQSTLQRSVYHAALPASVQRNLPATQRSVNTASAAGTRSGAVNAGITNRASAVAGSRTAFNSGAAGTGASRSSAAEAARQARASLGIGSSSGGSYSRSNSGSYAGADRSYTSGRSGGSYGGGYSTGSYRSGSYSGGSYGGGYSSSGYRGGSYSGSYHVSSGSYGGGSSRSGGSVSSGGSHGGGGGRGR